MIWPGGYENSTFYVITSLSFGFEEDENYEIWIEEIQEEEVKNGPLRKVISEVNNKRSEGDWDGAQVQFEQALTYAWTANESGRAKNFIALTLIRQQQFAEFVKRHCD